MRTLGLGRRLRESGDFLILSFFALLALFPIWMILTNSFKARKFIFGAPFSFPDAETFSLIGYQTVLSRSNLLQNFSNSLIVTVSSLALILLLGSMAAYALSEYRFKGNTFLGFYLAIGIMIPIRLGTVGILRLMSALGLVNQLAGLILIYIAQGLPMTVFILSNFMSQVPDELKQAARIDGASEYRIFGLVIPLVRPALGAIGIFTMIPIWNDLWFPLIVAPSGKTATVTLGVQQFLGQFVSDWNAVLSSLSMAMVPVILLYLLFSRQMIRSITAGALKS
ncbi:MAG TPA: carbohydrate ABC transporter permease [Rectinemataceae bacterium]|nr:carbohydrate ABC transporter permease [Rectinemataceae bacterium]